MARDSYTEATEPVDCDECRQEPCEKHKMIRITEGLYREVLDWLREHADADLYRRFGMLMRPSGPSDGTLAKERHDRCRYMLTLLNELAECNDYSKRQSIADGLARDIAETVSCWLPSTATSGRDSPRCIDPDGHIPGEGGTG